LLKNLTSAFPNVFGFFLLSLFTSVSSAEITAESVLGEYWKDPLFGEAAGELSQTFELLKNRVLPDQATIPLNKKIQIIFENRDSEMHIMAFSATPLELLADDDFKTLVNDTVLHARQKKTYGNNHQHSNSDVTNPQEFVKTMEDLPLVVVKPGARKEIIIRFDDDSPITIFCVLDDHLQNGYLTKADFSS
jgi:hypothetical protein